LTENWDVISNHASNIVAGAPCEKVLVAYYPMAFQVIENLLLMHERLIKTAASQPAVLMYFYTFRAADRLSHVFSTFRVWTIHEEAATFPLPLGEGQDEGGTRGPTT
jgi:hypothetical protein